MSDIPAEELKRRMREALAAARADTEGVPPASVPDWAREDPTVGDYEQRPSGRGLTREDTQVMELPVTPNPRGTFAERRAFADARVAETEDEMRAEELYEAEQARLRAEEDHDVEMETASPDIVAGRSLPAGMATVKGGDLPKPVTTEEDREEFIGSMMAPPMDLEAVNAGLSETDAVDYGERGSIAAGPDPEAGGAMWDEVPPSADMEFFESDVEDPWETGSTADAGPPADMYFGEDEAAIDSALDNTANSLLADVDWSLYGPGGAATNPSENADMSFSEEDVALADAGAPPADMSFDTSEVPRPPVRMGEMYVRPGAPVADMDFGQTDVGDMSGRSGTIDNSRWLPGPEGDQEAIDDLGREALADEEASESPAYEASEAPSEDVAEGEVPSLGAGFDDPDFTATLPAEDSPPGDLTDMDAMVMGLEGRVFEDGSIAGANGFPGISNPDDDAGPWESAEMTSGSVEPGGMDLADPRGVTGKTPDPGDPLARLDAGLPSEGDIEGAQAGDVVRRILHALGSAFRAGGGGTPTPFRSNAEELAEERRAGIRDRLDTKADFADTRARTESAERIAEGENETELARDASTTERARMRAETAADATDVRRTEAETRRGVADREAALDARMRDPASEDSAMARERLRALGEGLPPALREALSDKLASDQWSAYDVERMEENGDQWWRGLLGRGATRAGGGSGGGGGAYTLNGETDTPLERLIEARGINPDGMSPEEYIAGVGPRNARTAANTASRAAGTAEATEARRANVEFVEGVNVGIPFANPAARARATRDWDILRRSMRSLGEVERIFTEAGSIEPAAWPSTRRRIEQLITPMLGWVAENQNTGIIQRGEMERILRVIPGPDAGVSSLGEWRRAVEGLRSDMLANTRMWLSDRAAGDDDIARAMTALRTGRDLRRSGSEDVPVPADVADEMGRGGDMVDVRAPDGRMMRMPRVRFEANRDRLGLEEVSP